MYAAVKKLYRHGVRMKPQWPPLVGQLVSDVERGKPRLNLWPLDWLANTDRANWPDPLAVLWAPGSFHALQTQFLVTGLEKIGRRVVVQQWRCLPLSPIEARTYLVDNDPGRHRLSRD